MDCPRYVLLLYTLLLDTSHNKYLINKEKEESVEDILFFFNNCFTFNKDFIR